MLIKHLRQVLTEANKAYYGGLPEVMSDQMFDEKMALLKHLEAKHPNQHDPKSPSLIVGH